MNQSQIDKFYEDDLKKKKEVKKPKADWKKKIYKNWNYDRRNNGKQNHRLY